MADEDRLAAIMERGFDTLADLLGKTNARLDETNVRLDATRRELGERLDATNARLDATREEVRANGGRLDNLIELAGRESRALRKDVDELKERVLALEKKAS
jgi:hypothetical protein